MHNLLTVQRAVHTDVNFFSKTTFFAFLFFPPTSPTLPLGLTFFTCMCGCALSYFSARLAINGILSRIQWSDLHKQWGKLLLRESCRKPRAPKTNATHLFSRESNGTNTTLCRHRTLCTLLSFIVLSECLTFQGPSKFSALPTLVDWSPNSHF